MVLYSEMTKEEKVRWRLDTLEEKYEELYNRHQDLKVEWSKERNELIKQRTKLEIKVVERDLRLKELLETPIKDLKF